MSHQSRLWLGRAAPLLLAVMVVFGLAAGDAREVGAQGGGNTVFLPAVANAHASPPESALRVVAASQGVPVEQLEVVGSAWSSLPLSGVTYQDFKVVDTVSGESYTVALDAAGNEQETEALLAAENATYVAQYGKLDMGLAEHLAAEGGPVEVLIWLNEPMSEPQRIALVQEDGSPNPEASDPVAIEEFMAANSAARAEAVEAVVAPVASRLEAMGLATESNGLAPVVATTMDGAMLAEVQAWPEVRRIYRSIPMVAEDAEDVSAGDEGDRTVVVEPELEVTRSTIYAHVVHGRNILGHNSKIAQIEVGGRVVATNPYLDLNDPDRVLQDNTSVCAAVSGHSTGVAGIMVSSHPTRYGIAPGAFLRTGGSCGGASAELHARTNAAVTWGAKAINNSWGSNIGLVPGAEDLFYDAIVFNSARLIVKSAGNEGTGCGGNSNITSPGLGYNVLAVGNFNDRNTTNWADDVMSSCSSWRDPSSLNGDREKPEVAAPGSNINSTTTASPWTGDITSGTSFAAPHVTGGAALLYNRNSTLASWPESTKAILMATARNNIEGATKLSEVDGVGGIVLDYADDVARGVNGSWGGRTYTCSTASPLIVGSMSLVAGKQTRIVIVWDQNPGYVNYASRPSADLDLTIINSANTIVASSASFDNTYEIVEYTPSVSGTYRIRVTRPRCNATPAFLGWAWHRLP